MSSTSWFNKNECMGNTEKVKQFYAAVLKQFINRLYKENKFKRNIEEETIDQLEKAIARNLNKPMDMFKKCISMKEGSSRLEQILKNQIPNQKQTGLLKVEHLDEKDDYLAVAPVRGGSLKIIDDRQGKEGDQQQYVDDLEQFQLDELEPHKKGQQKRKSEVEVKRQDPDIIEYNIQNLVKAEEESESQADKGQLTIQECQQNLNSIILGTFHANSLKHKPKQQKTSIDLDNVFVKWINGQTFYGSLSMQANKLEKQHIRKQFPHKHKD